MQNKRLCKEARGVMNEFTIVTLIDRPVDQVFSVVQDVGKEPVWTPGLTEARQTSAGPMETGATIVYAGSFLGRKYETQAICTDWTENKRFATKPHLRTVLYRDRHHARAGAHR